MNAAVVRRLGAWLPEAVRLNLGRRSVRLHQGKHPHLVVRIARTQLELEAAFRLLHQAYVNSGLMVPHSSLMRITPYHTLPTTTTVIAEWDGKIVGTMSLIRDTAFGLPIDSIFDITHLRKDGARVFECSSLAVDSDYRARGGEVAFALMRFTWRYATRRAGVDRFVAVVNPRHVDMYKVMFGMNVIPGAVADNYSFVCGAPAVGLSLDLHEAEDFMRHNFTSSDPARDAFKYFVLDPHGDEGLPEREFNAVADPVLTPEMMTYFFAEQSDVFKKLSPVQIRTLRWIYDSEEYPRVLPKSDNGDEESEKRASPRFDTICQARLQFPAEGAERFIYMRVLDASLNGMRAVLSADIRFGLTYELHISLSPFAVAKVRGYPVWSDRDRIYGFRITDWDTHWATYIAHLEERTISLAAYYPSLTRALVLEHL